MSQTFPPPTLRFVGSDVNTVCSSAPVPEGAIWERGLLRSKKVPIKPLNASDYDPLYPAGASHVGRQILVYFFSVNKRQIGILESHTLITVVVDDV